jgi:hypothetical protein
VEKYNIAVMPERCAGCMCCQMICSLTYAGAFNPEEAKIVVCPPDSIRFTDECREGCILCVKYCEFGAITRKKEK